MAALIYRAGIASDEHLLPFEVFLLTMMLEERKRSIRLEERMDKLERAGNPNAVLDGFLVSQQKDKI